METHHIKLERSEARALYEKYSASLHYGEAMDREIARCYRLLGQGKLIIKAMQSIATAGLDAEGLPKLAIIRADSKRCFVTINRIGGGHFAPSQWPRAKSTIIPFDTTAPPLNTFPRRGWGSQPNEPAGIHEAEAVVPLVPLHLRPRHSLANYHVLWEADWHAVPRDPYLLRRLGKGDLWLVVAMWDLTEVERAALQARV